MSDNNQPTQSTYFLPVLPYNPLFPPHTHTVQIVTDNIPAPLLMPPCAFQTPILHSLPPTHCTLPPTAALPPVPVCPVDRPTSAPGPAVKRKRKTIRIPRRPAPSSAERRVARLERKLAIFQTSIEEAGCVELSLDDLRHQDNALLRLGKLERKAAAIWEEICELKGKSDRIMVMSDVLRNVNCTPYPAINERIERFFKRNILDLPDILDVSHMVSKVSEKEGLSLGKAEISRLSKQVLQYVGSLMSDRRRADLFEVLKSRSDKEELAIGPDLLDPVLKARLEENDAAFKTRLKDTLGLFCEKQDALAANGETDPAAHPISDNNREDNDLCDLEDSPLYSPCFIPIETPTDDSVPHSTYANTPALPIETHSSTDISTLQCTVPISKQSTPHSTYSNTPALPIETHSNTSISTFQCTVPISKQSTPHSTYANTPALPIETHSNTSISTFQCTVPISKQSMPHSTYANTPALPIETHSNTDISTFQCTVPISKQSTPHSTYANTPALPIETHGNTGPSTFQCTVPISKQSTPHSTYANTPALPIETHSNTDISTFQCTVPISKQSMPHSTYANTPALPIETHGNTGPSTFQCTVPISKQSMPHSTYANTPALPIETHGNTGPSTFQCTVPISKQSTPHSTYTNTPALPIETHSNTDISTFQCTVPISKQSMPHSTYANTPALPIETHSSTGPSTFQCTVPISKQGTSLYTDTALPMENNQFSKSDSNTFHCYTSVSKNSASLAPAPVLLESVPKRVKLNRRDDIPIVISSDED